MAVVQAGPAVLAGRAPHDAELPAFAVSWHFDQGIDTRQHTDSDSIGYVRAVTEYCREVRVNQKGDAPNHVSLERLRRVLAEVP
jgi:hypothetical protein